MNSDRIKEYLGKYICRIGVSKQRFTYSKLDNKVYLAYKDYYNQQANKAAPMRHKEMKPLVAIHQIMQHCLPKYFQKCRYVGLHANACRKKYEDIIPDQIKNNGKSIKTLFQILHQLLGIAPNLCEHCGHDELSINIITPDSKWIYSWLHVEPRQRGSPYHGQHMNKPSQPQQRGQVSLCPNPSF